MVILVAIAMKIVSVNKLIFWIVALSENMAFIK